MDLNSVITRAFTMNDRGLWELVIAKAACSTSGLCPDDWYPVSATSAAARREADRAIAVCAGCAVRAECLELALHNWAVGRFGVWGGTVPAEREEIRAGRAAQLIRAPARNQIVDRAVS